MVLGSGIRKKPIADPGSRGQKAPNPDPGSGSATLTECMYFFVQQSFKQCWGSVTFWCGSETGSADPYL
jgi:hypothetical protein